MSTESRVREHPDTRFAATAEIFDWDGQARLLLEEPQSSGHGHRQKALIREGNMTAALYLFDIGAGLPSHTVDGVVLIETLQGRLKVNTDEGVHALPAGCALRLSPGVRHDVQAEEPSRMLLIVALEKPDSHA